MNEDKARELAKRFGVRMCDENGDTHDEELYCLGLDDIIEMAKALAQPEQRSVSEHLEPVAKVCHDLEGHIGWNPKLTQLPDEGTPLYTHPPVPTAQPKELEQEPRTADEKLARMKSELAYMRKTQAEQEPVAWQVEVLIQGVWSPMGNPQRDKDRAEKLAANPSIPKEFQRVIELYTTPPQRTWVGLTDRERSNIWLESRAAIPRFHTYASLIEAKLKEKNT